MSFTLADGYEVYLDSMCECTYCPPNAKQCAHLDGHWVRLTHGPDCVNESGVPSVAWDFKGHWPVLDGVATWNDFYFPPLTLADAEGDFHKRDAEMRKIAREETD